MIVGLDFSLTATGVCAITDAEAECITVGSRREQTWWEFPNRVEQIAVDIHEWLGEERQGSAIVIESPAFGAKSSALDRMFGGWWLFARALGRLGYDPPLLVSPSQVKKFATSKGNASKRDVERAVWRRYPDVELRDDNQADALVLAAIGSAAYGEPFNGALTKYQQEVVEAVRLGTEKK